MTGSGVSVTGSVGGSVGRVSVSVGITTLSVGIGGSSGVREGETRSRQMTVTTAAAEVQKLRLRLLIRTARFAALNPGPPRGTPPWRLTPRTFS